jgi:hypothetical protein
MKKSIVRKKVFFMLIILLVVFTTVISPAQDLGDHPNAHHISQDDIEQRKLKLPEILKFGEDLFQVEFNKLDGLNLRTGKFNRITGPDTQACSDCHFRPVIGGAGPNIANVFAVPSDPNRIDITNPRNTNHLFGSGAIELLGIEMTQELLAIERDTKAKATSEGKTLTVELIAKGVSFGQITVYPNRETDKSKVQGVDLNLVIKPFSRKGIVRTLRQFTLNANNLHFGMQAVEVVGDNVDGDGDGIINELTVGDITAETAWQASLPVPIQKLPTDARLLAAVQQGERLFTQVGCTDCHRQSLLLKNPVYKLPNPRVNNAKDLLMDLTKDSQVPRLVPNLDKTVSVPLYADLKRHDMGQGLAESQVQTGVKPSVFITVPLWGVGDTGPWLHDGRATTVQEAIVAHGGEAEECRKKYQALSDNEQREIVEFLKSLVLVDKTDKFKK